MRNLILIPVLLFGTAPAAPAQDSRDEFLENWHQWRGPLANGVSPKGDPPTEWSESKNIRWKTEIPGEGSATPIVWKDRIFVLTAVPTKKKEGAVAPRRRGRRHGGKDPTHHYAFTVLCLSRNTGNIIWKKVVIEELPHEGHHRTGSYAAPSPTTDGKFVYASFGSRGLFCYDFDGNLKWKRDLGDMRIRAKFGEGSSPVIHGSSLIQIWDHEGDSYLYCLDARTGKTRWNVRRAEATTWQTPLVIEHKGVTQVVTNGTKRTRSYDLADGRLLWECGGQVSNPVASPVSVDGLAFCMTGHRGNAVYAIPLDSRGDITGTDKVAWKRSDAGSYVASPLLYDSLLYFGKGRDGIISCVDAKTGNVHFGPRRLSGIRTLYASPVGADGRVYITGRNGTTLVLRHGKEFKLLATNRLDEDIDASPVIVGRELFLRGKKHLYCISARKEY